VPREKKEIQKEDIMPLDIYIGKRRELRKNIVDSDKQLKPCIDWAYVKNLPLPPKPSFIEFYIVYVSSFLNFPLG